MEPLQPLHVDQPYSEQLDWVSRASKGIVLNQGDFVNLFMRSSASEGSTADRSCKEPREP